MEIVIYGPGCARCRQTERVVRETVRELGLAADVRNEGDFGAMAAAGVLTTPAVAVDGVLLVRGRVPRPAELRELLSVRAAPPI